MIQTDRLTIKPATVGDAAFMLQLLNTPSWITYIGDRNVHSVLESEQYLVTRLVGATPTKGCGIYTIFETETQQPIGISSLVKRDYLEHIDIGYALLPEYEGRGYAHEASVAVLDYAQNVLKSRKIVAITLKNHERSIQLLQKLGLVRISTFREDGEELYLFETKA